MFPSALQDEAARLLDAFRARRQRIATAESCTGGLIAALLTEIPGSSDVVERGFVTYSNDAKIRDARRPRPTSSPRTARSAKLSRAPWPRARCALRRPTSRSP